MPSTPDNPTGYWESSVLSFFNEELLLALGGSWSAPPPLEPGWQRDPSLDRQRASGALLMCGCLPTSEFGESWPDDVTRAEPDAITLAGVDPRSLGPRRAGGPSISLTGTLRRP